MPKSHLDKFTATVIHDIYIYLSSNNPRSLLEQILLLLKKSVTERKIIFDKENFQLICNFLAQFRSVLPLTSTFLIATRK